ncbi:TolC family protein [Herbaspirillum camelliae]|uniref:TolC family protein n=1 Tax=Herbaspirillum camelliae TaxID=1892903 RepID=UPI00094A06B6|nr:TolC family protein [Herbaspirillum camelliae]
MSVRLTSVFLTVAAMMSCLTVAAQTREWRDWPSTPLQDPLLARPPELDEGKLLPGDSQILACDERSAVPTAPLALGDAIDLGLCRHAQVKAGWARIKMQAAQKGEAQSAYLPTVNAGLRYQQERVRQPDSPLPLDTQRRSRSQYYTLTWRLLDFGGRAANLRAANASLDAALASHDAILQKTMASVVAAYYDVQTTGANRLAREVNERLARQIMDTTHKRAAKGMAARSDLLQVQTSLSKAELEHARAIGQHEKALVVLSISLGLRGQSAGLQVPIDPPDLVIQSSELSQDLEQWLTVARQHHPALLASRAQLSSSQQKLAAIRAEGMPSLDLSHGYYANGRPNQGSAGTQTRETVTGLSLNIPLFDGFSHTYKVRNAQAQIDIREAELMETEGQVIGELTNAFADNQASLRNLTSSQRLLDSAKMALDDVQRKYERGLSDIIDILNVQSALADASQERIRALAEWRSARLRLLASAGELGRMRITEHDK